MPPACHLHGATSLPSLPLAQTGQAELRGSSQPCALSCAAGLWPREASWNRVDAQSPSPLALLEEPTGQESVFQALRAVM